MPKPKTFKSAVLMRRIDKFGKAAAERSWKGSYPPEQAEEIEEAYREARLALVEYVIEHAT